MKNVYLGSVRTPIGRFGGTLSSWTAADLGGAAPKESARQAGSGSNVARQIIHRSGVPETPSYEISREEQDVSFAPTKTGPGRR